MVSSFKSIEECGAAFTVPGDNALGWGVPENSIREWIIKLFHEGGSHPHIEDPPFPEVQALAAGCSAGTSPSVFQAIG